MSALVIRPSIGLLGALALSGCEIAEPWRSESQERQLAAAVYERIADGNIAAVSTSATVSDNVLFVDAVHGDDKTANGSSPNLAFRTIGKAISALPTVIDTPWTINLAPGVYSEGISLRRFVMPDALSFPQLLAGRLGASISLVGPGGSSTATIRPASGTDCIDSAAAIVLLQSLICRTNSADGISFAGGALVMDDVTIQAESNSGNGIYADRSNVFFGGDISVLGPFAIGMSIRTNSMARTGTYLHPKEANLTFDGMSERAIFLRDGGNLTNAFENGTLAISNTPVGIYAILDSKAFLSAGLILRLNNVQSVAQAAQQSFINTHRNEVIGRLPSPFVRCHKASYIILETVVGPSRRRDHDTDGTCTALIY